MYVPPAFREESPETLRAFMAAHSFATLVTHADGEVMATHLPLLYDADEGPAGTLVGHVARANPQWQALGEGGEALAIFQGPHAYISPACYAAHPSVPTWNYTAVHACGVPELVEDPDALHAILAATVSTYEGGRAEPWAFDLPEEYVARLLRGIVGFRLRVTRLEGKFKLSQNRPPADQEGVVAALRAEGDPGGRAVADLMAARLPAAGDDADGEFRIRPFHAADEAAVVDLWGRCGLLVPWNDPRQDIAAKMKVQPDLFVVGTLAGKVVAAAMVGYEGHRGWVNYLGVDPELRRRGFARRLVEHAEAELRRRGCPKINLQVRAANTGVIAFYERLGFRREDVLNMGKRLE